MSGVIPGFPAAGIYSGLVQGVDGTLLGSTPNAALFITSRSAPGVYSVDFSALGGIIGGTEYAGLVQTVEIVSPRFATTAQLANELQVMTYDDAGVATDCDFTFQLSFFFR